MATHFLILSWKIPWTEESGRLHTHTQTHTHTHTHIHTSTYIIKIAMAFSSNM